MQCLLGWPKSLLKLCMPPAALMCSPYACADVAALAPVLALLPDPWHETHLRHVNQHVHPSARDFNSSQSAHAIAVPVRTPGIPAQLIKQVGITLPTSDTTEYVCCRVCWTPSCW